MDWPRLQQRLRRRSARLWRTGDDPAVAGAAIDLLCQHRSEKDRGADAQAGPLNRIGILGGGLMGGGIAYVTACKGGLPVRIKDIQPRGLTMR
jgi:hypothetical protein